MKKLCTSLASHIGNGIPLILIVFLLLGALHVSAQAPYQFSYQGVARDATGKVVVNSNITVRIKIHKDSPGGTVTFNETQIVQTNSTGVFTLIIGGLTGGLDDLNWGTDNCFLQTEIDVTGGANFIDLGTTALKSVPYSLVSRKWIDGEPIVQTGGLGNSPILPPLANSGPKMIWYPRKAAFRVGYGSEANWGGALIGESSFAAGSSTKAMGTSSMALGEGAKAAADYSIAIGNNVEANAPSSVSIGLASQAQTLASVAIGYEAIASGKASTSLGWKTVSKAVGGAATGLFNNDSDNPSSDSPIGSDRIFQIGNGANANQRSNAMTILRNGNIGIGNNALDPEFIMDFGGRPRIRHNGATAGIYFNNSQNQVDGFVGMKTDDQIGFYSNNQWQFWVDNNHSYSHGAIVQSSDKRLKTNILSFEGPNLPKLKRLTGYHYNWIDPKRSQEKQTGLIAQEVELIFPELVVTDKDGYKAVNYIGLIPHLIEAVKELDQKTSEIAELKKQLAEVKQLNRRMTEMEASLKTLLTGNTSAIGKSHTK